jgi:hypothetical protein
VDWITAELDLALGVVAVAIVMALVLVLSIIAVFRIGGLGTTPKGFEHRIVGGFFVAIIMSGPVGLLILGPAAMFGNPKLSV